MPSLTRLASAILLAVAALYMGEQYKLLYEDPPRMGQLTLLLAPTFAFAGWKFTGGRIKGQLVTDIFDTLQGVILGLMLALALFGTMEVFRLGYAVRYKTLNDAVFGFFNITGEHLLRMIDRDFLIQIGVIVLVIGVILSLVFRWAEARRLRK
ncbi:MAG: TrgA family protein [Roseinatronobacter sp.]